MKSWTVETQVTLRRTYIVLAADEKAAIAATVDATADCEDEFDEETVGVWQRFEHKDGGGHG